MAKIFLKYLLTGGIALVWLVNGLFSKLLNFVPRHQEIVAKILGAEFALPATKIIGGLEVVMVAWIISRIRTRLCGITQIVVVGIMNIMEFFLVPDLLLFGRANILLATVFMAVVYFTEFILPRQNPILEHAKP